MTERRVRPRVVAVGFGVALVLATTTLAWLVSGAELSPAMTAARAVADLAAATSLGLALVARLDGPATATRWSTGPPGRWRWPRRRGWSPS